MSQVKEPCFEAGGSRAWPSCRAGRRPCAHLDRQSLIYGEYFAFESATRILRKIAAKTKHVETREVKPYWKKRLEGRHYDVIRFRNGYAKNAPEMLVEFRGLRRHGKGRGAYYAISLGHILKIKRWKL